MVKQYSCISKSIHNMSSLLWRHSRSHQLSKTYRQTTKNTRERERSSKFIQNTRPEAGMRKKRKQKIRTPKNDQA